MKNKCWIIILVLAIAVRIVYLLLTPPGQLPDEKFHFKRIWTSIHYPSTIVFPDKAEFFYNNNEYYYPPLYYLISSAVVKPIFSSSGAYIGAAFNASIYILRSLSLIMGVASLILIWKTLCIMTPNPFVKTPAFSFIALLPSLSSFSVAANPANLSFFLITAFIYFAISNNKRGDYIKKAIFSGVVFGLAMLTKSDSIAAFPFIFYLMFPLQRREKERLKNIFLFLIFSFLFGGWWYLANFIKNGGPINQQLFTASISDNIKPFFFKDPLNFLAGLTYVNFVASFGAYNSIFLNINWYVPTLCLVAVSLCLLLHKIVRSNSRIKRRILFFLPFLLSFLINIYIFLTINKYAFQAQGRYLFNSIIFISLLWVGGLPYFLPKRVNKVLPALILSFLLLLNILGFGCNLQYFYKPNLTPIGTSCMGNYLPVGEIEADILPK